MGNRAQYESDLDVDGMLVAAVIPVARKVGERIINPMLVE
jgi:hypothetical protein